MEQSITFKSGNHTLEGLYEENSLNRCVIITHPHPLYGGEMTNPVVDAIRHAFRSRGYSTLRFNFRGTGRSEGAHDDGEGEQQDILSAFEYLKHLGFESIDLAGYSFGSWVNLMTASSNTIFNQLFLISPPVSFIDFEPVSEIKSLRLVVTGSLDTFAPPSRVKPLALQWNSDSSYREIDLADHFYTNTLEDLEEIIASAI